MLFNSGLMSTSHRVPAFCVINQTTFAKTVKVNPLRAFVLSLNKIKDTSRVLHKSELGECHNGV